MLFDLDDTLIDTRTAMHTAGTSAARLLWPGARAERLKRAGVHFRDDPGRHFAAFTRGELDFAEMRRRRVADLATWLGQEVTPDQWPAFEAAYEPQFTAGLRVFDDVFACLAALATAGLPVGVLTNSGADYTAVKLTQTGLAPHAGIVCTRDTLGFGKPDPRTFHEACRRLGSAPRETLFVGDEWVPDAQGAAAAGLRAVWLVRDPGALDDAARERAAARGIPVLTGLSQLPTLAGVRLPHAAHP